jgi:hypothetical protein
MFKKAFKTQNRNKLKRSEVRRFRTGLLTAFPHITEEQLNQAHTIFHLHTCMMMDLSFSIFSCISCSFTSTGGVTFTRCCRPRRT